MIATGLYDERTDLVQETNPILATSAILSEKRRLKSVGVVVKQAL
jgi:hypothetical protein